MTTFEKPALKHSMPAAARPTAPGRILPGRAGRGVDDLRAGSFARFRASLVTNQAIGSGTINDVPITWDTIDIDTDDAQRNNQAITLFKGEYLVAFTVRFVAAAGGIRRAQIEISTDNGATYNATSFQDQRTPSGGGHFDVLHGCGLHAYNRRDLLRVTVFQDSGAPLNITNGEFCVQFASPS